MDKAYLASFPLDGWRPDGSLSYGQDELYGGIPHVMVRIFPEYERSTAMRTLSMLATEGVKTARLAEVQHVDEKTYVYVLLPGLNLCLSASELVSTLSLPSNSSFESRRSASAAQPSPQASENRQLPPVR